MFIYIHVLKPQLAFNENHSDMQASFEKIEDLIDQILPNCHVLTYTCNLVLSICIDPL